MSHKNDGRTSHEIRREIEATRADIDATVDALERRLSPGQLLDQAWGSVRNGGGADAVRNHPVPLALMGLGIAWLAIEKATGRSHGGQRGIELHGGTIGRAEGRVGPYRHDAIHEHDPDWVHNEGAVSRTTHKVSDSLHAAGSSISHGASSAAGKISHGASSAADKVSHGVSSAADKISHGVSSARGSMSGAAESAKHRYESLMHDSPLAIGAIAFGLGLASGLAAPHSDLEDRVMGDTASTLKRDLRDTARDLGESASAVAADAADAARHEVERQHLGDELKDSARRVADEAKAAARERARDEHLTGDDMKDRAREIGEHLRRPTRDEMR